PVAHRTDAATRLAGEHGADDHLLDAGLLDRRDLVLVELGVRLDDDLASQRIDHVLERDAPQDALAERLDHLARFLELRHADAVEGAAVELRDDGVLSDVHEPARKVAGDRKSTRLNSS